MPQLVDPIDRIARRLQRSVLMLTFCSQSPFEADGLFREDGQDPGTWETDPARAQIVAWLRARGIPHRECFGIWTDGLISAPYRGFLFVDVPYDLGRPDYRELAAFLEDEDGTPRHEGVGFHVVEPGRHRARTPDPEHSGPGKPDA